MMTIGTIFRKVIKAIVRTPSLTPMKFAHVKVSTTVVINTYRPVPAATHGQTSPR